MAPHSNSESLRVGVLLQTCRNVKLIFDNWNISTNKWLRYICYERVHSQVAVFTLSSVWHGFYGGYYLMFFTASLFFSAGRYVRHVNHKLSSCVSRTHHFSFCSDPPLYPSVLPSLRRASCRVRRHHLLRQVRRFRLLRLPLHSARLLAELRYLPVSASRNISNVVYMYIYMYCTVVIWFV